MTPKLRLSDILTMRNKYEKAKKPLAMSGLKSGDCYAFIL